MSSASTLRLSHDVADVVVDLDDTLWPYQPVATGIAAALGAFLDEHAPRTAKTYSAEDLAAALTAPRSTRTTSPIFQRWMTSAGLHGALASAGEDASLAAGALSATAAARQRVVPFPDAEPAIERLRTRYRVSALTDGSSDVVQIGVTSWFDDVFRSAELGASKPDPRVYVQVCERLRVPTSAVLHVGDDLVKDVEGALAAGLHAAWVNRLDVDAVVPPEAVVVRDMAALADLLGV